MFPKPPRPEPPRRAVATQVVQQKDVRRVPDTLVVNVPAAPPAKPPAPAGAGTLAPVPADGGRPV